MPRRPAKTNSGPPKPPAAVSRSTPSSVGGIADSIEVKATESATPAPTSQVLSKRTTARPSQKAAEAAKNAAIEIEDSDEEDVVTTRSGRIVKKRTPGSLEAPAPPPAPKRQASAIGGQSSIYSQASFTPVTEPPTTGTIRPSPLAPPAGLAMPAPSSFMPPGPLTLPNEAQLQLQKANARIKDLEATVAKKEAEAKAKAKELTKSMMAREEALKHLKMAQQHTTALKEENAKLAGNIAQTEYRLKQAESELSNTKEDVISFQVRNNHLAARVTELQKEISDRNRQEATQLEKTKQEIRAERDQHYHKQLQEAKQKLAEAEQKMMKLTEEKKAALSEAESPVANLDTAKTKSRRLQHRLDASTSSDSAQAIEAAERITALEKQLALEQEARAREMKEHDEEVEQMLADAAEYRKGVAARVQHLREIADLRFPGPPFLVRGASQVEYPEAQEVEDVTEQQPQFQPSHPAGQPADQPEASTAPAPSETDNRNTLAAALATAALQAYADRVDRPQGQN